MSRSNMARANFKKYTEITNPLKQAAPQRQNQSSASPGVDSIGKGAGFKDEGKGDERKSAMKAEDDENEDDEEEEDPFGLEDIMTRRESRRGISGIENSGTKPERDEPGGTVEDEDEDEDEDPFGLGAIMASGESKGSDNGNEHGESRTSGTKRSAPTRTPGGGGAGDDSCVSSKAPRTGGYFSEPSRISRASPGSKGDDSRQAKPNRPFVPASTFQGARESYVFQMGRLGLGYYVDKRAQDSAMGRSSSGMAVTTRVEVRAPSLGRIVVGVDGRADRLSEEAAAEPKHVASKSGKVQVDVPAAVQKIGPLLMKPKKAAKAASLMADLMQAEMRPENALMFFRTLRPLAEQPASEAALACGEAGARVFNLLLERAEWLRGPADGVRAVTWELLFGLRHEVKTDDSFQFARAVKRLRQAIEALGDVTGRASGDALDARIDDSGREASLSLSLERKKALIEVMKETFKSYHLAWARSSIEPAFKAAADRRRLFPEGDLRDVLDGFTDVITKRQRNPGGAMAPPTRTVRVHNSVAHPTLNKRSDVIR